MGANPLPRPHRPKNLPFLHPLQKRVRESGIFVLLPLFFRSLFLFSTPRACVWRCCGRPSAPHSSPTGCSSRNNLIYFPPLRARQPNPLKTGVLLGQKRDKASVPGPLYGAMRSAGFSFCLLCSAAPRFVSPFGKTRAEPKGFGSRGEESNPESGCI